MRTKNILFTFFFIALFSCEKDTDKNPKIETIEAESVAAFTCYAKASVSEKGSYEITDHGFVYSMYNGSFGIENGTKISLANISLQTDTFSTTFSFGDGYNYSQSYYVRAYLTNKIGTVYGSVLSFAPLVMSVGSVTPTSGKAGDRISITGNNFSTNPEDNVVNFNTTKANVVEASSTKLVVVVPDGIATNYYYDSTVPISVSVGGQMVNSSNFTVLPTITGFSPGSGTFGTAITISGQNLSSYGLTVKFNDIERSIYSASNSSITSIIPYTINSEKVKIKIIKNGIETIVPGEFTMDPCSISSLSPAKGFPGTELRISGQGFNTSYYTSNVVKIGGVEVSNWIVDPNTLSVVIPESMLPGTYDVEVNNGITNAVLASSFTVIVPEITSFSPASGYFGSEVTINGENLNSNLYVYFGNYGTGVFWSDTSNTSIKVKVPSGIAPGKTKISISSGNTTYTTSTDDFTVLPPVITGFSPASGVPGTEITITGNGFMTDYYSIEVKFGTVSTNIVSVTPTEIKALVPSNAGAGAMKIAVSTSGIIVVADTNFIIEK